MIGIGGTGLSAIARVLLESGNRVSGSDMQASPLALSLQEAGVPVYIGHRPENVHGADLVIRSSAIPDSNPEVVEALRLGLPVYKRADFLGKLMVGRQCIAVAGTHGKTTTTAMIAWIFTSLGQNPSYIIGGVSENLGANAHAGNGPAFVIEADEYDRMFLGLQPSIAVVTNIEHDHPDCYPHPGDYFQAFLEFSRRLAPQGILIACADDPGAVRLMQQCKSEGSQVISYSTLEADYRATSLSSQPDAGYSFEAHQQGRLLAKISLQVPGIHNVRNALAALAVARQSGLPVEEAAHALSEYRGAGRRFEVRGQAAGVTVIDDYAHHPTEIRATLAAARARYPGRTLWAVWQPHTFSRTQALFTDFVAAFGDADHVLVTEVYASREGALSGQYSSRSVVEAMSHPDARYVPTLEQAADTLVSELTSGDVVLVMSAGDADQISGRVLAALQTKEKHHD